MCWWQDGAAVGGASAQPRPTAAPVHQRQVPPVGNADVSRRGGAPGTAVTPGQESFCDSQPSEAPAPGLRGAAVSAPPGN